MGGKAWYRRVWQITGIGEVRHGFRKRKAAGMAMEGAGRGSGDGRVGAGAAVSVPGVAPAGDGADGERGWGGAGMVEGGGEADGCGGRGGGSRELVDGGGGANGGE